MSARDLLGVEVEAGHAEARLRELERERQPDVAEPDHADARLARVDRAPSDLRSRVMTSSLSAPPLSARRPAEEVREIP